jgi:large repetitive protein
LDIDPSLGTLTMGAVTLGQAMTINMGGGTNYLRVGQANFNGPAGNDLAINAGEGSTTASFDQTAVLHLANFTESPNSGSVILTLDHFSANYLNVQTSIGNDSISLTDGTHINAAITMNLNLGDDVVDFDGVTAGSVSLLMGQGANEFTGTSDIITNGTSISGGAEADTVDISGGSTGSLTTTLAGGGNTISLTNLTIANAASIGGGLGTTTLADSVTLNNVTAGSLSMTAGTGNDTISLSTVHVTKAFNIDTGSGSDTVTIDGLSAASLWGMFDAGADIVSVENTTITGKAMFGGGVGTDTYNNNGGNTFGTLNKVNFELPAPE